MKRIVFLDRDGTINKEKNYLYKWEEFEYEDKVIEGLVELQNLGYEFIVITNQSGIARGYYTEEDVLSLNKKMCEDLEKKGVKILECKYCPHHPEGIIEKYKKNCNCRKPKNLLLEEAIEKYNVDRENSYMVGDKVSDIKAGLASNLVSFLVKTGHGNSEIGKIKDEGSSILIRENLLEVAKYIKDNNR